jgi:uncharacterized protein
MPERLHRSRPTRLGISLVCGMVFGFLLQRGGVTDYDVIIGQLLLRDFTVLKMMLSAVVVGSLGIHALRSLGLVTLHPKPGSLGSSALGGLVFGFGFATLGYCPGTVIGAVGSGALDALFGGMTGILLGSWLFALAYPRMRKRVLLKVDFGTLTLPEWMGVNAWVVVLPGCLLIVGLLWLLERAGL